MNHLQGTGVAAVTPFNINGEIDFTGLEKLINHMIDGGVDYIVSLGTTGETATLSPEEKYKVWEFTTNVVDGRVPLVAGIGGNNTLEVAKQIKNFSMKGYSAILSVRPYYSKPNQEGIYQHYKYLNSASSLPIILYNVPGRTGSNMSSETTCRLAHDFSNIVAIKEASANFDQFNAIMRDKPSNFSLISGDDPITLQMIAMGAIGVISVVGNALPTQFSSMVKACLTGDFNSARATHQNILEFTRLLFSEGNPAGVKSALKSLNICEDYVRLPLVKASPGLEKLIQQELKSI